MGNQPKTWLSDKRSESSGGSKRVTIKPEVSEAVTTQKTAAEIAAQAKQNEASLDKRYSKLESAIITRRAAKPVVSMGGISDQLSDFHKPYVKMADKEKYKRGSETFRRENININSEFEDIVMNSPSQGARSPDSRSSNPFSSKQSTGKQSMRTTLSKIQRNPDALNKQRNLQKLDLKFSTSILDPEIGKKAQEAEKHKKMQLMRKLEEKITSETVAQKKKEIEQNRKTIKGSLEYFNEVQADAPVVTVSFDQEDIQTEVKVPSPRKSV